MSKFGNLRQIKIMPETQTWFNNCHASSIVKIGPSDFLCAFMGGEREEAPDLSIWLSRCENGVWRVPMRIKSIYRLPHWNPVLHMDGSRVWLFYKVGPSVPLWYTMASWSDDLGVTWSCSEEAVPGDHTTRVAVRNKLLVASDGSWLGPCSNEGEKYWDSMVDISRDGGRTWNPHPIPINHDNAPQRRNGGDWEGIGDVMLWNTDIDTVLKWDGVIQPTLWESKPGTFHAFMRSTRGRIYRSDSFDNGETWCEAYPTNLPNNNSGIDLARLADGTLALAHNPVSGNWTLRTPLSVSLSFDNGETFPERLDLETGDGEFSYPAIIAEGGTIHMTYTFKRKSIVYCSFDIHPSGGRQS